jgi:hypothetical protein
LSVALTFSELMAVEWPRSSFDLGIIHSCNAFCFLKCIVVIHVVTKESVLMCYRIFHRKVRHKNVVQFIGACTNPPNLCIVTGMTALCFASRKCILFCV